MPFGPKRQQAHAVLSAYTDRTAARSLGTTFTNNSGGVRVASVQINFAGAVVNGNIEIVIGGVVHGYFQQNVGAATANVCQVTMIIPDGVTYRLNTSGAEVTMIRWFEADFS